MKLYPLFTAFTWAASIGAIAASPPSTADRSAALARNRPPGKHRLVRQQDVNRNLQSYSTIDGYDCFRDMNGMTQAMLDLETNYPDLVSIEDIGDSYLKTIGDGGYDIYVMKITASKSNPSMVLLTGGHHAREYAPPGEFC